MWEFLCVDLSMDEVGEVVMIVVVLESGVTAEKEAK